jgi:hypothetical protein
MLDIDRLWQRVAQYDQFRGRRLAEYIYQAFVLNFTLTTGQTSPETPIRFPGGAIIGQVAAAACLSGVAGTQTGRNGLDMFSLALATETGRQIIGTARGIASCVFGTGAQNEVPLKELIVPVNGSLQYTVENLTTSTILVSITHHALVPSAVG